MQSVESKCDVRRCFKIPATFGPLPTQNVDESGGWGSIPRLEELGSEEQKACLCLVLPMYKKFVTYNFCFARSQRVYDFSEFSNSIHSISCMQVEKGLCFVGGENAALGRVDEYFWKKVRNIYLAKLPRSLFQV